VKGTLLSLSSMIARISLIGGSGTGGCQLGSTRMLVACPSTIVDMSLSESAMSVKGACRVHDILSDAFGIIFG